jgi:butyrate kinase
MNEDDLRDCFAMFAMLGLITDGSYSAGMKAVAQGAYEIADEMLEARKKEKSNEEDSGIAAVVPKRPRKR